MYLNKTSGLKQNTNPSYVCLCLRLGYSCSVIQFIIVWHIGTFMVTVGWRKGCGRKRYCILAVKCHCTNCETLGALHVGVVRMIVWTIHIYISVFTSFISCSSFDVIKWAFRLCMGYIKRHVKWRTQNAMFYIWCNLKSINSFWT